MSHRLTDSRSNSRWRHWLLAFTALFSRSGSPTSAPRTEVGGRADVEATRTRGSRPRTTCKTRVLVSTGSTVPGHVRRGKPACGATDETTGGRVRMSNRRNIRRTPRSHPRSPGHPRGPVRRRARGPISACRSGARGCPSGTAPSPVDDLRRRSWTAPCSIERRRVRASSSPDPSRPGRRPRIVPDGDQS